MNPEFRRYVWLELSPLRLWSLPLVVIALVVLATGFNPASRAQALLGVGGVLYAIFAIWGAHKAAQSVTSEVMGGTWDLQRLAQHRPAELLVGKLFGSPVFEWLGLFCALAVYAAGALPQGRPGALALDVLTLGLAALWLHALALFFSLAAAIGLRATRRPTQGKQTGALVAIVLVSLWVGPVLFRLLSTGEGGVPDVAWWWTMPSGVFFALSIAMFLAWTLVGAYRLIRAELQEPVSPGPWIGWLAFLTLYLLPFVPATAATKVGGLLPAACALAVGVCGVLFYPLLLGERKDVVRLRSLAAAWGRGDGRGVWTGLPLWVFNLVGYALGLGGLVASSLLVRGSELVTLAAVAGSCGLFLLRDLAWVLAVHLSPRPARRPDLVVYFFLAVLYGLVPALLAMLGQAGVPLVALFVPGLAIVQAAEQHAAGAAWQVLWGVPGLLVAGAWAALRLRGALERV